LDRELSLLRDKKGRQSKYLLVDCKIKNSVFKGLSGSVFSSLTMYLGLRVWILLTVSLGPVDKLYALVDAATVIVGITSFLTVSVASYTAGE
jgi:hypothetical protein